MLPEGSGLEAVERIQALDPKLPIIFITGGGTSNTTIEAMKLGAYDYLLKPLDLPKLKELVDRAMEIRRLMQVRVELPTSDNCPVPTAIKSSAAVRPCATSSKPSAASHRRTSPR